MKRSLTIIPFLFVFAIIACKKDSAPVFDAKSSFAVNCSGTQRIAGAPSSYKFSLDINPDNTVVNIDSVLGNTGYPGT